MRLKFVSHLRLFETDATGRRIAGELGAFSCVGAMESFGVEDARTTLVDDVVFMSYVSVSEHGACTSLATTRDFRTFDRLGVVFCSENKDVVLFPERDDAGELVALHRPNTFQRFCKPEIWLARSVDGRRWGGHVPVWAGVYPWERDRVGAGCPPVRLRSGRFAGHWLELYHGSEPSSRKGKVGAYRAGAMVLDGADPSRVLAVTPEPIMAAAEPWEREGFVDDVVFPTGLVDDPTGEFDWLAYYGGADTALGVIGLHADALFAGLVEVGRDGTSAR
jgi:predicted GH43/DUF377 family glycosyl hydrolase